MDIGANVINAMLILISVLVAALLVQQIWLAIRLADRNDQWLDAIKAVSDELQDLRTTRGAEVEGVSSGGGASDRQPDDSG